MKWKNFAVFSPQAGLVTDVPSILLPSTATPDIKDMYFQSGEVKRYRKRIKIFEQLPDAVISQFELNQASEDRKYFLYFTKRDIVYRDRNNERFVFITPALEQGYITSVEPIEDNQTKLVIDFATGDSIEDIKAGDFIRLGDSSVAMTTDDVWYEIVDTEGADTVIINGDLPTGYYVPTEGDQFVIRKTFLGADTDIWVCDNASETLIATNNGVDFPIMWQGGTNKIKNLTEDFKCRWINYYGGRAVASYIMANGNLYPVNVRWSGLLEFQDWGDEEGSDAGENALTEGQGYITRGIVYKDALFIIKSESIERLWAVEDESIFYSKVLRVDLGTKAPHSFILNRDIIYFYCTMDRTFRTFDGYYDRVISRDQDPTIKNITASMEKTIKGYFVNDTRQLIWSVPYAGSLTLNKMFIADMDYQQSPWTVIDMPVQSFGRYEIGSDLYWDSLNFPDWLSWNWASWLSSEDTAESAIDVCSDLEGNLFQMNASRLDIDEEYESHIVFETDLSEKKGTLPYYKRLLKIQFYCRDKGAGTVKVFIKRDLEEEYIEDGEFELSGGKEINVIDYPTDNSAKTFKIKLSSVYDFELIGFVAWYTVVGER